ncbi:DNA-binding response regulator, NarL/FixJ family, contains REC and HTH domains [Paenibacillus catalpae]|uniref:DNA-binding response regulator, NarL/FixJ family, contains REC and HTH domains n=1 Tax=Paenibacillus catalpae TaxID=1045775 RepID=A0A1I1VQ58_9BACL|nr:response regulator transcription factor [Paenibacillus catalpae]SFD84985.1 DNA-binding response regulator, NarL/FixJ family, contains REC and HTH domains [Paenibacillus catalpae]
MRILIVDDQRLMREGLATIIGLESGMEVIGTAVDGQDAYAKVLEMRPDVVLMDIRMPGMDGVEGSALILKHFPETKVLILTTFDDSELIIKVLENGVHGYLLKDMPSEAIIGAIRTVYNGGTVLQHDITSMLLKEFTKIADQNPDKTHPISGQEPELYGFLTEREKEVLALLGQGLNNKEIAGMLFLTEGTVKNHVSNLISKLGLRDRTQAAIYAVRHLHS